MTLNHNEATAIVTIDGLGICCFNHAAQEKWDLAFLRDPPPNPPCPHELKLEVDGQEIPFPDPANPPDITFVVVNAPPLDYMQPHDGFNISNGFFAPLVISDRTEPPLTAD